MPCWRISVRGRPALMIGAAEREVAAQRPRIAPLVVIGLGYNSLWERARRRYGHWASRFDGEALRLLAALRRRGARQVVWVTLREPTRRVVPPAGWAELRTYAWYFPYVNERLRRLDRRHDDVVLADWAAASGRPGLTYDSIHLNARGAARMARTIEAAIVRGARRPAPGAEAVRTPTSPSAS
jgi:lysophospholipase L1-like esterase